MFKDRNPARPLGKKRPVSSPGGVPSRPGPVQNLSESYSWSDQNGSGGFFHIIFRYLF